MIARPERIAYESLVWVLPAIVVGGLAAILGALDIISGRLLALAGFAGADAPRGIAPARDHPAGLVPERSCERFGIFRSARPNDMVEAGVGRTFQNIRLFQNMTAIENILVGMHTHVRANLPEALFNTPRVRQEEKDAEKRAEELLEPRRAAGQGQRDRPRTCRTATSAGSRSRARSPPTPKLLLLDEPAAGMNPKETQDLVAADLPAAPRPGAHRPAHRARHEAGHGDQRPDHRPRPR